MRVQLTLEPSSMHDVADLIVTARITYDGASPARLNTLFLEFPSIVLQARDASGQPVPLGPPPVPPEDDGQAGRILLMPGQSWSFQYRAPFATSLSAGRYALRFYFQATRPQGSNDWEGILESDWMSFRID